jgi:hypothetical protein
MDLFFNKESIQMKKKKKELYIAYESFGIILLLFYYSFDGSGLYYICF